MPKMELALRRSGSDGGTVELIWRGGETARGDKRSFEISAGVPIEGKAVVHDAIAHEVAAVSHGSIVTADCAFESGRGFVATRVVSIAPFETRPADDDHDALVLGIRTHAEAKNFSEAERLFGRLLELEPRAMPLPPVTAALKALGPHASGRLLKRVASFFGAHASRTGVFPTKIAYAYWPPELLVAYAEKLGAANNAPQALADVAAIDAALRAAGHGEAADDMKAIAAKLETAAGKQDRAIAAWASSVLGKGKRLDLGKTVKVTPSHLADLDVTAAVRKVLLGTALPARVAPHWRATLPKSKPLQLRAKGYYTIGIAEASEEEQITASLVIDRRGRVHHIVDDGDPDPELVASSLEVFATRLHVLRSYITTAQRTFGKGNRVERFEAEARVVLKRVEPSSMADYWDPQFWIQEA